MKNFIIPSTYSEMEYEDLIIKLIIKHARPASEVILDDVDLRNLLKISRRTSLEYRKKGIFKFYKLDGKIFYILEEVIAGIKKYGKQ
ncbi:MAG: hypothetical protein IPP81_19095 [Chitinophagaceae bacterium]|nr:hypothetical protein [Chitinophagaceae bacterium]